MSYLKSLLTGLCLTLTTVAAMAFPTVTVSPSAGSTLTDKYYFEAINLTAPGCTVKAGAEAELESNETGDLFTSTMFKEFMGSILIKFNSDDITDNGEWILTIPAGSLVCGDEENPALTFTYTLSDPNLGGSDYPQITLVSSDPADGSKLTQFGGTLTKISFKTSDDDAVNYIAWTLYDVTAGEGEDEREYVRQGNENRYDLNRNGNNDDSWVDGLFVNIGGEPEKLVKDHKYKLELTFAGIGYNPETNQYPRPDQIASSTELETAIYYYGLTDAPEYSPYTYVSVSPDPETYEIETANGAMFTITYSGPVKPAAFNYFVTAGTVSPAGTYAAVGDTDADGCCDKWEFTFDPAVLSNITGTIATSIQTKDKDGLYVKGNGGYLFDDIRYSMSWSCNVGAPDLTLVSPSADETLETLSEIVVGNSNDLTMAMSYSGGSARIVDMQGAEVRVLDDAVAVDGANQMKWTFEPITEAGSYVLMIPAYYFSLGEEFDGAASKKTEFRFYVEGTPGETGVVFDLEPTTVTPADYSTVTEISTVELEFAEVTYTPIYPSPTVTVYKVDGQTMEPVATATGDEGDDFFDPKKYVFTLDKTITEAGAYMIVFPQATFYDEDFDTSMGESGHANDELAYIYLIKGEEPNNPDDPSEPIFDIMPASVTPADSATVTQIESVKITFANVTYYPMFVGAPEGKLYKADTDEVIASAIAVDNDWFDPTEYTFTFATPVTDNGTYKFVVAKGSFCDGDYDYEEGKTGHASPELSYTYIIANGQVGIQSIVAEDGTITVYTIGGVKVAENVPAAEFDSLAKGLYIINGTKVIKNK